MPPLPRLAPQRSNPGTRGQNVRYDVRGYPIVDGRYVDPAGYHYSGDPDNALSDDRPDAFVQGLFPADDERSRAPAGAPVVVNRNAPRLIGQATRLVQQGRTQQPVSPAYGRAQARVAPVVAGAANALIEAVLGKATRSTNEINARTSAIGRSVAPYGGLASGYYEDARRNSEGVGRAVADAIRGTGQALQADIAGKLAGIQAPTTAIEQGRIGEASGAAASALGSAELERLRGTGDAASAMMGALPRIAELAGATERRGVLNQLGGQLTDKLAELYGNEPQMILDAIDAEAKAEADAARQRREDAKFAYQQKQDRLDRQRDARRDASTDAYRRSQIALSEGRLTESRRYHDLAARLADGRLTVSQYNAATSRINAGTAQARLNQQAAQNTEKNAQAWERLGISSAQLKVSQAREDRLNKAPAAGGFTPNQVQKLMERAVNFAQDAFKGYTDKDGNLVYGTGEPEPYKPVQVWKWLLRRGVPPSIAQRAIKPYAPEVQGWYHPKAAAVPSGGTAAPGGTVPALPASFKPTHQTSGLGWPAVDAFGPFATPGNPVGSPVDGVVKYFHPEGAQGGGSMRIRGDDGSEYWVGHIANGVPAGTRVRRGQQIAVVANQHESAIHVHVARRQ